MADFSVTPALLDPNLVLGPLLISSVLNVFFYGICVLQLCTYWAAGYQDNKFIKSLVAWVFLLDTFHTSSSVYMLWNHVVTHFNDPNILTAAPWPFTSTPIIITFTSLPIQVFLAWRIRQFSGSTSIFFLLMTLAIAQGTMGVVVAVVALPVNDITKFHSLIPLVATWMSLALICDLTLTIMLTWYLNKHRTGHQQSDNVISRIIRSSVETASIGALFCLMDLITFTTLQNTNIHTIFAIPLGRIYTITLMMTLNSRASLRSELSHFPDDILDPTKPFPGYTRSLRPLNTMSNVGPTLVPALKYMSSNGA